MLTRPLRSTVRGFVSLETTGGFVLPAAPETPSRASRPPSRPCDVSSSPVVPPAGAGSDFEGHLTMDGSELARVEVIVEVPKGSRNKYEIDHDTGEVWLDRLLFTATRYPADYGFLPRTLAEDDDPLDALVLGDEPTFPGCHCWARPVAVFLMADEAGPDAKVLFVPDPDPRLGRRPRPARPSRAPPVRDPPLLRGLQGARAR